MAFFQVQIGRSAPKTAFKLGFRVPEETCGNHAAQHFSIAGEKKKKSFKSGKSREMAQSLTSRWKCERKKMIAALPVTHQADVSLIITI